MADWLERYRCGERAQVWHELRQLGDRVRDPGLVLAATEVCTEMARRARRNVELIVERLTAQGFRWHSNDARRDPRQPFRPASATAPAHRAWLDDRFGPLPLTVAAWLEIVGDVWLVGTHPEWSTASAADPLVIELEGTGYPGESMRSFFDTEYEAWQDSSEDDLGAAPFVLPIGPDRLTKADVSGGAPYAIRVPDGCADGLVLGEVAMPFVDYLNWTFAGGGFPGPTTDPAGWRIRRSLAVGLLPL